MKGRAARSGPSGLRPEGDKCHGDNPATELQEAVSGPPD
jgi:hypothetical protein